MAITLRKTPHLQGHGKLDREHSASRKRQMKRVVILRTTSVGALTEMQPRNKIEGQTASALAQAVGAAQATRNFNNAGHRVVAGTKIAGHTDRRVSTEK